MDISDNIVIERGILKKIIFYLTNHYNEREDKTYRSMLNYMIVYLTLLNSK